jgi:hypothetical protein
LSIVSTCSAGWVACQHSRFSTFLFFVLWRFETGKKADGAALEKKKRKKIEREKSKKKERKKETAQREDKTETRIKDALNRSSKALT